MKQAKIIIIKHYNPATSLITIVIQEGYDNVILCQMATSMAMGIVIKIPTQRHWDACLLSVSSYLHKQGLQTTVKLVESAALELEDTIHPRINQTFKTQIR
jgi:hypothetical protein